MLRIVKGENKKIGRSPILTVEVKKEPLSKNDFTLTVDFAMRNLTFGTK